MMNLEGMAHEISDVLALDYESIRKEVEKEIHYSGSDVKEAGQKINFTTEAEIEDSFRNSDAYIIELMVKSSQEVRNQLRSTVLSKVLSHWNNQDITSLSMLDYGGSVGTDTIFFASNSFQTSYFDSRTIVSNFAKKRFNQKKINIPFITNLQHLNFQYDFVTAFEESFNHIDEIIRVTKSGGLLFLHKVFLESAIKKETTDQETILSIQSFMEGKGCHKIDTLEESIEVYLKGPSVTVIVPIYNAYDDTKALIDSIQNTSPGYPVQWLLSNDASSDTRIEELLQNFASVDNNLNVIIDTRLENLGFVKTCNLGIETTLKDDVILLNSDTIVYDNWVRKLVENAYSDPTIATVTPLSNNASAFSMFQTINPINSFNNFLNTLSVPPLDIPTGVGFCLYIKRSVIEEIGVLDPIFGFGYGEETDFCQRAAKKGYRNVLAQNVFVYHKGGASMVAAGVIQEGDFTIHENEAIVAKRYPEYPKLVDDFIASQVIHNIDLNLQQRYIQYLGTQRASIAFIIHVDISVPYLGGTEFHLRDVIHDLQSKYIFYLLSPSGLYITISIIADGITRQYSWRTADYLSLLQDLKPNLIHIHHLKGFSSHFIDVLSQWNGPKIFTIHDYYGVCKSYSLIDDSGEFCGVPDKDVCQKCALILFKDGYETPLEQRRLHQQLIDSTQIVLAPSETAIDVFRRGVSVSDEVIRIIPHALDSKRLLSLSTNKSNNVQEGWQKTLDTLPPATLRVGFIGYGGLHKGETIAQGIIVSCKNDPINFICLGAIGNVHQKNPRVANMGNYQRHDVIALIHQSEIDVIILCSPWPETYSYTLTESWLAGVPVICGPLGAPSERVSQSQAGIVLSDNRIASFVSTLRDLLKDKAKLQQLKEAVSKVEIPSDYTAYQNLYDSFISTRPVPPTIIDGTDMLTTGQSIVIEQKIPLIESLVRLRWNVFPVGSLREKMYFKLYQFVVRLGARRTKAY